MPRNGSGIYGPPAGTAAVPNTTIESADYNSVVADMSQALTDSINVDGTAPFQANQPMGDNKLTGLGSGSAASDSVTLGQAQSSIVAHASSIGGTADAITATFSPAFTAWTTKMRFRFTATAANASATPTINVDSLGARTIRKLNGIALDIADIAGAGHICECIYNGTDVILLNFAPMTVGEANTFTEKQTFTRPVILTVSTLADAGTIAWDMNANSVNIRIVLSASRNLGLPTNINTGQAGKIVIQQDGTGGWTLTPNAIFRQAGGQTILDLDKTANSKTVYTYDVIEDHTATKVILIKRLWSEGKNSIGFWKEYNLGALSTVGLGASKKTQAHGLGREPALVQAFIRCTSPDLNYPVGHNAYPALNINASNTDGFILTWDSTNVHVNGDPLYYVYGFTGAGSGAAVDTSKWDVIVRVYE